jgi:lipoprotein-releasing system ATP-binding protein
VFQFHQLLPEFTALENVCIPAFIAGSSTSDAEKKAKDLLAKLGLENRINHKPNELSGGEKQRVAVARALINQPSLILADEPSGSLDSANKKELHSLLRRLCNEYGLTILVVTHDKDLADVSDRVIEMRDGSIVDATTK